MRIVAGFRTLVVCVGVLFFSVSIAQAQECTDGLSSVFKRDIDTTKAQASDYKPGLRNYYVQEFNDRRNVYLRAAISPKERAEFLGDYKANPELVKCLSKWIDELAVVVKQTLHTYRPVGYTSRTPAEDKLLRSSVSDIANATVFRTGVDGPNWQIEKNEYGIPTSRFKYGMMFVKYSTTDDGYCRIIWSNIVQDYAGGGTYGASYGSFVKSEPAGCPAAK